MGDDQCKVNWKCVGNEAHGIRGRGDVAVKVGIPGGHKQLVIEYTNSDGNTKWRYYCQEKGMTTSHLFTSKKKTLKKRKVTFHPGSLRSEWREEVWTHHQETETLEDLLKRFRVREHGGQLNVVTNERGQEYHLLPEQGKAEYVMLPGKDGRWKIFQFANNKYGCEELYISQTPLGQALVGEKGPKQKDYNIYQISNAVMGSKW